MKKYLIILYFSLSVFTAALAQSADIIRGVDISFIPEIESLGGQYRMNGIPSDPVEIFRSNGAGYVRLRMWHTPANGYCGLQSTLNFAKRIKQKGMKFLLDIHYSDWWADPGQQTKPAAWSSLSYNGLLDSIYAYTYSVMQVFRNNDALPDMVQIGNEITGGFLWPEGKIGGTYNTTTQWQQFTGLLKKAKAAIVAAVPDSTIPVMIHIDRGGDNAASRWFYDNMSTYQVQYDYIGLSYYPWWHGTLTKLTQNMNDLAARYGKKIFVAETAYPFTLGSDDNVTNIVGSASQLHSGYPATVDGQYNFLYDVIKAVKNIPNSRGGGVFYWAPEYISVSPIGSPWENLATFDFSNNALSSLAAFQPADTSGAIRVTFRLNTAAHGDTLKSTDFVQIRGEIINGPDVLASGEQLKWDENSGLIMQNASGDYWQKTVRIKPGLEMQYKYWTGHSKTVPTFVRLGWEGPVTPYDSIAGNYRKFIAGANDTVIDIEYYNPAGTSVTQFWRPFIHKTDSVAVFLKVSMAGVTSTGRFNPANNGPVGARGGAVNNTSIMAWDNTRPLLVREQYSIRNGSFWSGTAYYPVSLSGMEQPYKFFIEGDTGNGWENSISNRTFTVPQADTTVYWVNFDNQPIVGVEDGKPVEQGGFKLLRNYPNPFNNSTRISYYLPAAGFIEVTIYNAVGQKLSTLVQEHQNSGNYTTDWTGQDDSGNIVPSGIYFIQCKSPYKTETLKAVLLK